MKIIGKAKGGYSFLSEKHREWFMHYIRTNVICNFTTRVLDQVLHHWREHMYLSVWINKFFAEWGRMYVAKQIPMEYASEIALNYYREFVLNVYMERLCYEISKESENVVELAQAMFTQMSVVTSNDFEMFVLDHAHRFSMKMNLTSAVHFVDVDFL
jgi:hypothetical protein